MYCRCSGLRVETSSNVFVEDLQSTRSLETTYYVTDATQAYDSLWERESGLRVHIGIMNVHLIPEYEDVDTTRVSTPYTGVQTQCTPHHTCEDSLSTVLCVLSTQDCTRVQTQYTQHRTCEDSLSTVLCMLYTVHGERSVDC